MNKSEQLNELFSALAKAQAEMYTAGLTASNPFFKSKYADLTEIVRASRPALTKNGLSVTQVVDDGDFITILGHSSGQYISSSMKLNPSKPDVQALGSYLSYLRRYQYAAIVGVITGDEDDDGNYASNGNGNHKPYINDRVTPEQLEQLEDALDGYPDLAKRMKTAMNIERLSDLLKSDFMRVLKKIQESKAAEPILHSTSHKVS